jgi:hypothetical protein
VVETCSGTNAVRKILDTKKGSCDYDRKKVEHVYCLSSCRDVCLGHCVRTREAACGRDYRDFSFRRNHRTDPGNNGAFWAVSTGGFCPSIMLSKHEAIPPRPYAWKHYYVASDVTFVVSSSGRLFCGTPRELVAWLPGSLLFLYNPTFSQATCSAHIGFLLTLVVNPEDGGGMFLRNSG